MTEDDGYGKTWTYRVFSQLWDEPDVPESGRRYLSILKVWPRDRRGYLPDYPTPDDIAVIDSEDVSLGGHSIEQILLQIERINQALNKPALILAEWRHLLSTDVVTEDDIAEDL
jgi:hypothetical protein